MLSDGPAGGIYPPFCEGLQTARFAAGLHGLHSHSHTHVVALLNGTRMPTLNTSHLTNTDRTFLF